MGDLTDRLESICQCGVCLEVLNLPRTLVCQHTFCIQCLKKACQRDTDKLHQCTLICPTCRTKQPFVTQPKDVEYIAVSQVVKELSALLLTRRKCSKSKTSPAKPCFEGPVYDSKRKLEAHLSPKHLDVSSSKKSSYSSGETEPVLPTEDTSENSDRCRVLETELRRLRNINLMLFIDNTLLKMNTKSNILETQPVVTTGNCADEFDGDEKMKNVREWVAKLDDKVMGL